MADEVEGMPPGHDEILKARLCLGLPGGDTRLADGVKLGGADRLILCLVHAGTDDHA